MLNLSNYLLRKLEEKFIIQLMEQNKELKHPLTPRSHFYEIQKEDLMKRFP